MPASRPLHAVFLERVIYIEPVQRERARAIKIPVVEVRDGVRHRTRKKAINPDVVAFFEYGHIPGTTGSDQFLWPVNPFDLEVWTRNFLPHPMSPALLRAWNAADEEWGRLLRAFINGELILTGTQPGTPIQHDLKPTFMFGMFGSRLLFDVRANALIEERAPTGSRYTLLGGLIVREAADSAHTATPEPKLGRIDWGDLWEYATDLREQGRLLNENEVKLLILERYGVTVEESNASEVRRFVSALRQGDSERPKSTTRKRP
jgi:hypothetical protein